MKVQRVIAVLVPALLLASTCLAGQSVSIRLVEAGNTPNVDSAGLADVIGVLRNNLPYSSFKLVASSSVSLPARKAVRTIGAYKVSCSGQAGNLVIAVSRGRKVLLNTRVELHEPLFVGGFPTGDGKHILVFVLVQ